MLDVPLSVKVEEWRRQCAEGTISMEELQKAVAAIRAGRISAAQASAKSRAVKAPVDTSALLDALKSL